MTIIKKLKNYSGFLRHHAPRQKKIEDCMQNLKNSSQKPLQTKSEHQIQNEILAEFGARKDMRIWRQNTGAALTKNGMVRFGVPGQADITGLLIPSGRRIEIEVKDAKGRQRESQIKFQAMIEKSGGIYILARSVDDVWEELKDFIA